MKHAIDKVNNYQYCDERCSAEFTKEMRYKRKKKKEKQ